MGFVHRGSSTPSRTLLGASLNDFEYKVILKKLKYLYLSSCVKKIVKDLVFISEKIIF